MNLVRNICVIVIAIVSASWASAQDVSMWNKERANAFTHVCLGGAPNFRNETGRRAQQVGFRQDAEGLILDPEVRFSLQSSRDSCTCYMTVGAPDLDSMVVSIFEEMLAQYGDDFRPDLSVSGGLVNDTTFLRDGEQVRVTLTPGKHDGLDWVAARAMIGGAC